MAPQHKPVGRLQRHIYWLNSLGMRHGMLVDGASDLKDGVALVEAITALLGEPPPTTIDGGIHELTSALDRLRSRRGWAPSGQGSVVGAASAMLLGDADALCDLLGFLEGLAVESPELLTPTPPPAAPAFASAPHQQPSSSSVLRGSPEADWKRTSFSDSTHNTTASVSFHLTSAQEQPSRTDLSPEISVPRTRAPSHAFSSSAAAPPPIHEDRQAWVPPTTHSTRMNVGETEVLGRRYDLDVDDSVRIGSQSVTGLSTATTAMQGTPGVVQNVLPVAKGPSEGDAASSNVGTIGEVEGGGDSSQVEGSEDHGSQSFAAFIAGVAKDLASGRILSSPEGTHTPDTASPIAASPHSSPQRTASPHSDPSTPLSRLDALTRLAEASEEEMEAVAESVSASPGVNTPPSASLSFTAPKLMSKLHPDGSELRMAASISAGGGRKAAPRSSSTPRTSRHSSTVALHLLQGARRSPVRLRDVKPKVDTGSVLKKSARKSPQKAASPRAPGKLRTGLREVSRSAVGSPALKAEHAGRALQAAASKLDQAQLSKKGRQGNRAASIPSLKNWQPQRPSVEEKREGERRKAYIQYAMQRSRRPVSADVILARTRHGVGPAWFKKALGKDGQVWLQRLMDEGHIQQSPNPAVGESSNAAAVQQAKGARGNAKLAEENNKSHVAAPSSAPTMMPVDGYAAQYVAQQTRLAERGRSPERMQRRGRSGSPSPARRQSPSPAGRSSSPQRGHAGRTPSPPALSQASRRNFRQALEDLGQLGEAISPEAESATRTWLRAMQMEVLPEEEGRPLLENPLRNGVLLCELVGVLEGCPVRGVSTRPTDVLSCRRNIHSALLALGLLPNGEDGPSEKGERAEEGQHQWLAWQVERVLQGHNPTIWKLLTFLRTKHPRARLATQSEVVVVEGNVMRSSLGTGESFVRGGEGEGGLRSPRASPPRQRWREVQLPYDHASTCALEQSLMRWMAKLGLVEDANVAKGLDSMMGELTNGTLLCDLVGIMEGRPIKGVNRRPRTRNSRQANIHCALDHLWAQPTMSRRFLRHPDALLRGERAAMVGLLEDIHRLVDGAPRRQEPPKQDEQPYLQGTFIGIYGPLANHPAVPKPLTRECGGISPTRPPWCPSAKVTVPSTPTPGASAGQARSSPARLRCCSPRRSRSPSPTRQHRIANKVVKQSAAASRPSSPATAERRSKDVSNSSEALGVRVSRAAPSPRAGDRRAAQGDGTAARQPTPGKGRVGGRAEGGRYEGAWRESAHVRVWAADETETYPSVVSAGDAPPPGKVGTETSMRDLVSALDNADDLDKGDEERGSQEALASWVEALGIRIHPRWPLEAACRDGLLLCALVGKLQHSTLQGTTAKPTSRASCLHNVTKALEVLRNKPNMAVDNLWKERAIVAGETGVAPALLEDIRRAFRQVWTGLIQSRARRPPVVNQVPGSETTVTRVTATAPSKTE